ncbi:oligosaccharide repeat unit polymerase [Polynucleobacter paneuropaeus]|nr:oligosaccharide repeat unit polymerase [Polynucleobacter paneuropaeus]
MNQLDLYQNFPLILTHVLIGIISVKIVVRLDCGMLTQAAGIFFLIFFSIFPINELNNEIIYWGGEDFTGEARLFGACATLLFVFFFWTALNVKFSSSNINHPLINKLFIIQTISAKKVKWLIFFSFFGMLILFQIYDFQLYSLFVKGGEFSEGSNVESKIAHLFVEFFLRPMLFNMGLTYILLSPKNVIYKAFFILVMFFSASPSGISRFLVAALYMPLVLAILMIRRHKNSVALSHNLYLFPSLLLLGLIFIFPLLEVFRDFSIEKLTNFSFSEYQNGGHFDAFQMFLRALDVGVINYGYGFLGALLFFIPRSIWPSKPVTSGIEISQLSDLRLDNVSMPIIGELYLNFWYFGIIFGAPLIALLFKKIDSIYLKYKCSSLSLGHLIYFQLAGLVIYNMRGGFLSSFAYTVSILMTWLLIGLILAAKMPFNINLSNK